MGGVGLQQLFIIIFSILVLQLLWGVRRVEKDADRARRATLILGAVLLVLLLITVSCAKETRLPLECQQANTIPGANHLPHLRVRPGTQQHDPEP
jgi:multisubunit Na+/H+ antiporter MnhB subunit